MTQDEINAIAAAVEQRLAPRFEGIDKQIGDLTNLVQAFATGTAKRFDSIEQRLSAIELRFDDEPPRSSEGWKPSVLS